MAYDSTLLETRAHVFAPPVDRTDDDFRRGERLVVVAGASALGAMLGAGTAIALGRVDTWMILAASAPLFLLAMHLTWRTMREAVARRAYGCSFATVAFFLSLAAWPAVAMFYPLDAPRFWIAPASAFASLLLLASCWKGTHRTVYRTGLQGTLLSIGAGYLGLLVFLGS